MSINRVNITGNLTRDAALTQTESGFSVMKVGIAVNRRHKNQDTGEWDEIPNYFDCVMFGNRAAALAPRLTKGLKASIDGELRQSSFQDRDGNKRNKIEIVINEIEFVSSRRSSGQPQKVEAAPAAAVVPAAPAPAAQSYDAQEAYSGDYADLYDSDVPF